MSNSPETPRINPWTYVLIGAALCGGLFLYIKYVQELGRQNEEDRVPYYAKLETNLDVINQDGEAVKLGDLQGKVYLINYIFTRCPGQCIGVGEIMKQHLEQNQHNDLFRMVSISLDPANDTPEHLKSFAESHKLPTDKWWFLTGDETSIRKYMRRYFKWIVSKKPEDERTTPRDLFEHKALIGLVDHKGHIRGVYSVYDEKNGEQLQELLRKQLDQVLVEAMKDTKQGPRKVADIDLQKQGGAAVKFSDLKGKVTLVSHVFTRCPRQCPGICALVKELRGEFADDPNLHIASFTMDPAHDTPEVLKAFSEQHELVADNWWFLTGDKDKLPDYMAKQFRFIQAKMAKENMLNENDLFEHDSNVVLLDHEQRVIGKYDVVDDERLADLKKDMAAALKAVPAPAK